MVVKFKKLSNTAKIPQYMSEFAAGMDICADINEPVIVNPGEVVNIGTGLAMEMERQFGDDTNHNFAAFIFGRSGLGIKHGIHPANAVGVIDSDYRGEIRVGLCNVSKIPYMIQPGERIAQIVIMPVLHRPVIEETDELSSTSRSDGGFGSTGKV